VDHAVKVFDNIAVDSQINRVKPYYMSKGGNDNPRTNAELLSRRLYLMNIPYDSTVKELELLVKEFAQVD
jgi:RNA recognition motif-containing protein